MECRLVVMGLLILYSTCCQISYVGIVLRFRQRAYDNRKIDYAYKFLSEHFNPFNLL